MGRCLILKILNKKISDLKEYENNPRINDDAVEYVKKSIEEFGYKVPIVIDKNNVIIAGHTRLKALKELGVKNVDCVIADDLSEEQVKAFRLADNKVSEASSWDWDKLGEELNTIPDIDMSEFGFDLDSLDTDLDDKEIVEDEVPEVPEKPKAKLGDIYQLGNHRLMCGDSTDADDVKKLMNSHIADLILTDPPYNVNYEGSNNKKILNDNMTEDKFYQFLKSAFFNLHNSVKEGGSIYVFHSDIEGLNFRRAMTESGFKLAECLVWIKNAFTLGCQDYQWQHEPILYGWKLGASHYFIDDRSQSTTLEFDKPTRNEEHPTMKPIELLAYLINNSSKENDIVLDLFGGSGSTMIACEQTNRKCYMMELEPKWVDVIIQRWENFTGKKAVKIKGE